MEHHLFNVIFTGHLIDGFESDEVIKSFSSKFKIPEAKARKIILAQKQLVLKPRAEHVKAYKFKSALESIGMEVKLERAMMAAPKAPVATTKQTEKKPVKHTAAQPNNIADPKPGESAGNASWSLEPIEEKPTETADEPEPTANVHPAYQRQLIDETESNTTDQTEYQENTSQPEQHEHNNQAKKPLGELIKTIGGVAVGIVGILLIAVKKFGLFKFLKIGGLMTAAAFAGYEAEEVCMGNGLCEDAIDEQIDDCWEQSGFEDHDWENMSDEQYFSLKPKIENEFIGCFVYEDTGQRVLESPIEVRFDLIDNCYQMGRNDCLMLAESQLKSCYAANNIAQLIPADTMNFYQAVIDHPDAFKNYYSCFVDANGGPLFAEILQNWDVLYYPEY
jgi:hypothetical protein